MKRTSFPSREYELLDAIKNTLGTAAAPGGSMSLTLGDDAAVRRCVGRERLVLTADIAVENVHFSPRQMSLQEVGFKTMAANVSDCAAMAARPEAALVELVFPAGEPSLRRKVEALYRGFAEACRAWHFRCVGGDLSAGPCWTIGITMIGVAPADGRLLLRTGIRSGDALWVSAFPGRSAAGLAALERWGRRRVPRRFRGLVGCHVRPGPSPELGVLLARNRNVHAMMDLSDGIAKDGRTLCHENRLGLAVSLDTIEPPPSLAALAGALGTRWQEWFLEGGEEYSLLFAASPAFRPSDLPGPYAEGLVPVGVFTRRHTTIIVREGEKTTVLPRGGWDHIKRGLRSAERGIKKTEIRNPKTESK